MKRASLPQRRVLSLLGLAIDIDSKLAKKCGEPPGRGERESRTAIAKNLHKSAELLLIFMCDKQVIFPRSTPIRQESQ